MKNIYNTIVPALHPERESGGREVQKNLSLSPQRPVIRAFSEGGGI
jgi:hypothetical protein